MTNAPSSELPPRDNAGPSLSQQVVAKANSVIVARRSQLRDATMRAAIPRLQISRQLRLVPLSTLAPRLPTWTIVPLSIVIAGMVTAAVAEWSARDHARAAADAARHAAPMVHALADAREISAARGRIASLFQAPTTSATIDAVARALPPESRLLDVGRDAAGRLSIVVLTSDPDLLRRGIAEQPLLAGLRDQDQRPDPTGAMRVMLRSVAS